MSTKPDQLPDVTGKWTGVWNAYTPAKEAQPVLQQRQRMEARVEIEGELWKATFEAECGRPYKYVVLMEGRRAGDVVLFRGTTDLGADDGGVFDWIGRATDREFIGFYTSAHYTGAFSLSRHK